MTCRELADFLADYLAGELPDDRRAAFEHHLARCPACVHYVAAYRAATDLGRRAFEEDQGAIPADVPEELVRAILASRKR